MGNMREAPSDGGLGEFLRRWRGGWQAISTPPVGALCYPGLARQDCRRSATQTTENDQRITFLATKRSMPSFEEIGTAELILMGKQTRSDRNRTMRIPQLGEQTLCGQPGFHVLAQ